MIFIKQPIYFLFANILCFSIIFHISQNNVYAGNTNDALDSLLTQSISAQAYNFEQADSLALQLLHESREHDLTEYTANAFKLLATTKRLRNHNIEAISYYKKALTLYSEIRNHLEIHEINKWLGLCYAHESEYTLGLKCLNSSYRYADSLGLINSKAQILLNKARFYKSKGEHSYSLLVCNSALVLQDSIDDKELAWKINNFTGYMLLLNNEHKKALEIISQSLAEQSSFAHNLTELYRLNHYMSRINIFFKNFDNALEYLFISEEICKTMPNKELGKYFEGLSHMFIGNIFMQLEEFDSSKVYLKSALLNPEYSKDLHAVGHINCYLGDLYFNTAQYDSAMHFYTVSTQIHELNKEKDRLYWAKLGIGKTYYQVGEFSNAIKILLVLANEETQNMEIVSQASEYLSNIYSKQNNYQKAYLHLKIYKESSEQLINKEKIKDITKLEIEHEYKTKQNELELVNEHQRSLYIAKLKQNRLTTYVSIGGFITISLISILIFRSFRQKKKASEEKEVLLKEIHHRVKNNLQVISSILSLQSNHIDDKKVKIAITESQDRVKSMALIHQMLYQQDKFSEINVKEYITELSNTIRSSQNINSKDINFKAHIPDLWLDIDTAVPLGLIVNELLTNAYKYAFKGKFKGQILLEIIKTENKKYLLKVSDDGVGMNIKDNNLQPKKTLGLNMVKILSKQLKGSLSIENESGTSFNCTFSEIKKTTSHTTKLKT